jgi:hypothetical protein
MSRIEPFAQWINENTDYSDLSLEELKQLRENGLLDGDGFEMYQLAVEKFLTDQEVSAAIDTIRKKFDLYAEAIFPYDEYSDTWEQIQNEANENGPGELGWFEYLMFG